MKDFIGQELQVGDRVVFVQEHYTGLATGQIVKFTKMARHLTFSWNSAKLLLKVLEGRSK